MENNVESSLRADYHSAPLPYAAVPLDLGHDLVSGHERITYHNESLARIQRGLFQAVEMALEDEWIASGDEELALRVRRLLDISLTQSHETRLFLNRRFEKVIDGAGDERIVRAAKGMATPIDLLSVLVDYPTLGSIELAKLSHPLDAHADEPMDRAIQGAIHEVGGHELLASPKYKPKTRELDIPAMTVLRKRKVGMVATNAGDIGVISRQAFLVRGDEDARQESPYVDRKIRNPERFPELAELVESSIPTLGETEYMKWLQPVASSYYAKYL